MVGGDASLPLSCGWEWFLGDWNAVPEQTIYGYGVCATAAPLFWGAESISDLALRRSLVGASVVPLVWLTVRFGAVLVLPLGALGLRVAAAFAAIFVLRHDGVAWFSMTGVNGYFAGPFVCLILLCWILAFRGKAWWGFIALSLIPVAMMNHPFTLWLLPASLPLAWVLWRRGGAVWILGGLVTALGFSWPRILLLRESLEPPDARTTIIAVQEEVPELLRELGDSLQAFPNLSLAVGAALLVWFFRRSHDMSFGRAWAWAGALGLLAILGLGAWLKYLRYYHLIWVFPFVLLPLAAVFGRLFEKGVEIESLSRIPFALRAGGMAVGVLGLGLFLVSGPRHPLQPWCLSGSQGAQSAGGTARVASAIYEHLQDQPSDLPILVGNLNSGAAVMDSAFPVVLDLALRGIPRSRLSCCAEGQQDPIWYWIVSPLGGPLGTELFSEVEGAELLLEGGGTGDWLVAFRSEEARRSLERLFCQSYGAGAHLALTSHSAAMERLPGSLPAGIRVPVGFGDCVGLPGGAEGGAPVGETQDATSPDSAR